MVSGPFARRRQSPQNEINLTLFIDVMQVFMIVFLVTIRIIRYMVKIILPHASVLKDGTVRR